MKKNKYLIGFLMMLIMVSSFFIVNKKTNIKFKKLKELNYNVTYKQAFPDKNLRRGVLLCIMRNQCNDLYFLTNFKDDYVFYDNRNFLTDSRLGTVITEAELEAKEEEQLSKEALDKLQVLVANNGNENISSLQGIEFLPNIKHMFLKNIQQEDIDLSYNKELIILHLKALNANSINLTQNIKLDEINAFLSPNEKNLELSHITNLHNLDIKKSGIKNITLSEGINIVDLSNNKIEEIIIPSSVRSLTLNNNKISNIDVRNNTNLTVLDLSNNLLEDIDVRNNPNLSILRFGLKTEKDTIDFNNNSKLKEVLIEGNENGKIKSLDFSNKPNLYALTLKNLGITNLNIENNIGLGQIFLENNNLNTIDLSKHKNIWYAELNNNNTQNMKLPIKNRVRVVESRKIKGKKNSYITIPKVYFNDKEYFLDQNSKFERVGDKYVFKNAGNYQGDARVYFSNDGYYYIYWRYFITVELGEEDSFNPVFNQGNYIPIINEEIPVNKLKEMITNLPANIKTFELLSSRTFTDKGEKVVKVRIRFSDDTFKEVDIPIKVYEKEDILPTVTVTPETLELIEKKPVNINITRSYAKEDNIDPTNFIKTVRDNLVSYEYLNKANGLTYNSNSVTGVIDYLFTGTEEEHTFNITYKEKGNIYTFNKNISIKLLRDTDKDGIADKDDDDKDGDGFSNAVEIARGSDPYNKDSLPDMSKKDELDNLVKQLEKLIEDTKNNPFDTKNKLDVDNLKNNFLPLKVTEKDNIKGSYSLTTSDSDLLKLINKVKSEIDDIKKEINKLRDKIIIRTEEEKELEKENIKNPKTGLKTYSLIILFIIFVSYILINKKKRIKLK